MNFNNFNTLSATSRNKPFFIYNNDIYIKDNFYIYKYDKTQNKYVSILQTDGKDLQGSLLYITDNYYYVVESRLNYDFMVYRYNKSTSTKEMLSSKRNYTSSVQTKIIIDNENKKVYFVGTTSGYGVSTPENWFVNVFNIVNNELEFVESYDTPYENTFVPYEDYLYVKNGEIIISGYKDLYDKTDHYGVYKYDNLFNNKTSDFRKRPTLVYNEINREKQTVVNLDNNILIVGGVENGVNSNKINIYNKRTGNVSEYTMPIEFLRENKFSTQVLNDVVYVNTISPKGITNFSVEDTDIYSNTWGFYDNTGTQLRYEISNYNGTLVNFKANYDREQKNDVLLDINTNTENIVSTYSLSLPKNDYLIGYSRYPNSNKVDYSLNEVIQLNLLSSSNFYEVYETVEPPPKLKTYRVCDNSGLITRWETTSQSSITALKFEPNGFRDGFVWFYLNPAVYGPQYTAGSLTNNIIGYSRTPNATQAEFLINTGYSDLSIDEDTTFYEVYNIPYTPPTTNNQYRILNSEGIVTLLETDNNLLPLVAIRFGYDKIKGVITFSYIQSNGEQTNTYYSPVLDEGVELIGYSLSPYAKTPTYTFDEFIEVNIGTSTNFYEVYNVPPDVVYTVYSSDGQSLKGRRTTNNQPVYEFRNYYNEFDGIATVQLVQNDLLMTIQYRPTIPQGYALTGYAITPNAQVPLYPVNSNIQVNFTSNTAFYEVYELIYTDDLRLDLYQSSTEPNRVDKSEFLRKVGILTGTLREECSIVNPVITMEIEGVPNFNYIYIPNFQRYYFVDEVVSISKNIWEVSMTCDVLMTYRGGIYQLTGFIDRNEFTFDDRIVDNKRVVPQGYSILDIPIENELFTGEVSYVLTGTGLYVQ